MRYGNGWSCYCPITTSKPRGGISAPTLNFVGYIGTKSAKTVIKIELKTQDVRQSLPTAAYSREDQPSTAEREAHTSLPEGLGHLLTKLMRLQLYFIF